jgi:hypothetical protein
MNIFRLIAPVLAVCLSASIVAAEQYDAAPDNEEESLATPAPDNASAQAPNVQNEEKVSLPFTPYPAGLSWVLTPQAFRVPIPNRIYYPPHTYVRRCPYYPRGYYWGANWRFNVVGQGNLLFFGPFRFNPYLTAAKAQRSDKYHGQKRYAPPPGPVGQAMLLGSSGPSAPVALPPTSAGEKRDLAPQVATVHMAPLRRPARAASSRRVSKASARSSAANSR